VLSPAAQPDLERGQIWVIACGRAGGAQWRFARQLEELAAGS